MKRKFLIPGHPEALIKADHVWVSTKGMMWFIDGDFDSFLYDDDNFANADCRYSIVAQFQSGVLILPEEDAS